MMELTNDLRNYDLEDLNGVAVSNGQPKFRGGQLFRWVHKVGTTSVEAMTDLPQGFRETLGQEYGIGGPRIKARQQSALDGTIKLLLEFNDGMTAESVIMPHLDDSGKATVCVSSQIGCPVGCSFCATGEMGFSRNLTVSEILSQVYLANEVGQESPEPFHVSNVVFMGMGEPFLNYEAVIKSLRILTDPQGLNIGERRLVVSTSGYVPGIRRFAEEGLQVVLAVSLHSADNGVRDGLVPLNRKYPLESLLEACCYYQEKTGRRITFEYVMIEGCNDSSAAAMQLAGFLKPLSANVNLIPLNAVSHSDYKRSSNKGIGIFFNILEKNGVEAVVRKERGSDIAGACGQLRSDTCDK